MKLVCPDCGMRYDSGKFCSECGSKLQEIVPQLICPSCGTIAKSGKFCPECGAKLVDSDGLTDAPKVEEKSIPSKPEQKSSRFAKYYDKDGFPRTIPQEEKDVAIEELTPYSNQGDAEAKMLLGSILVSEKESVLTGCKLLQEAEHGGNKIAYYFMWPGYMYGAEPMVKQNHNECEKRLLKLYNEYPGGAAGPLAELYTYSEEKRNYKKAFKYATIAAEADESSGNMILGQHYLEGWGVKKNLPLALENYKLAAADGDAEAMNQIGIIYMGSEDFKADPEQSFYWFNEAARKGSSVGMNNLGYCYSTGFGVESDLEKAAEWYKKAADMGYADSMVELARYYRETLIDFDKAESWYIKAVENGNAAIQNELGVFYYNHRNDSAKAVKWYKLAMEQENPDAYSNYALCLWDGLGVKENKKKALELMRHAVELGCPDAEDYLKKMQEDKADKELKKAYEALDSGNAKEAIKVIKKYAEEGDSEAMWRLGSCYLFAKGVKFNLNTGLSWVIKAADKGIWQACCTLVEAYSGAEFCDKSTAVNINEAKKYLSLAKKSGAPKEDIKRLEKLLTPSVEISNVKIKKDITVNGQLGIEVTAKLLINGMQGEKLNFSVLNIMSWKDKYFLAAKNPLLGNQCYIRYCTVLKPVSFSSEWNPFCFFIPYKSINNSSGVHEETLYMMVWTESKNLFNKLCVVEQPFRMTCKTHLLRSDEYSFELLKTKWK